MAPEQIVTVTICSGTTFIRSIDAYFMKVKLFIGPCLEVGIVLPFCKNGSGYGLQ